MGEFRDNSNKAVVRKKWCKPILKCINKKLRYRLIYMGLPGPQALDLKEWLEYIDQVIAFQCRDYPNPSSISQPKDHVIALEKQLISMERQGRLTNFILYDGFIEEVILRGRDTNGNLFAQNDIVTIYNLDFCNGITVPLDITDDRGNIRQCYKSDAIRRLLEIQRDITSQKRVKKFVMFLTVHTKFWDQEAQYFTASSESQPLIEYLNSLSCLNGAKKRVRLLRAYIHDMVKGYFCNYDFTPEFLPVINYKGSGCNWLCLFTIVGAVSKGISKAPCFQNTSDFLRQKFLTIQNERIDELNEPDIQEENSFIDPVEAFLKCGCYVKLWNHT